MFLQETIKQDFALQELESLEFGDKFFWSWLPAVGHSGGMLLAFRDSMFEVRSMEKGNFFLSASVVHRVSSFIFQFIGVYGPADHSRSPEFLLELDRVDISQYPVVVAGDFNLIRGPREKSNRNICWPRVHLFNDAIARLVLREVARTGANFTWSNKQLNHIRCVLDRVLISPIWETKCPLTTLRAETSIGSDHTPLILDSREEVVVRSNLFFNGLADHCWLQRLS